jgi:hypothetical protein
MPKVYPSWGIDGDIRAAIDARAKALGVSPSALVEGLGRALLAGDVARLDEHVRASSEAVKEAQRARGAERLRANAARSEIEERRVGGVQRARAEGKFSRPRTCGTCGQEGHNRRNRDRCPGAPNKNL